MENEKQIIDAEWWSFAGTLLTGSYSGWNIALCDVRGLTLSNINFKIESIAKKKIDVCDKTRNLSLSAPSR